jgi:hypothetical protein
MVDMSEKLNVLLGIVFFGLFLVSDTLAFQVPTLGGQVSRRGSIRYASVPTLEDWIILPNGRVEGKIRNHPEIEDGAIISTSPINPEDVLGKDVVAVETKSGSQYLLISPNPRMESILKSDNYFSMPTEEESMMVNQIEETEGRAAGEGTTKQMMMQQVKDAGIAGVISYAFWELGFWTVSVPVCIAAYRQVTGHWPDFSNQNDLEQLGAEAFAFVNVARFAVPLRIGLALSTTPWVQRNIVDRFSKPPSGP